MHAVAGQYFFYSKMLCSEHKEKSVIMYNLDGIIKNKINFLNPFPCVVCMRSVTINFFYKFLFCIH